jgi:hypothetical protein
MTETLRNYKLMSIQGYSLKAPIKLKKGRNYKFCFESATTLVICEECNFLWFRWSSKKGVATIEKDVYSSL